MPQPNLSAPVTRFRGPLTRFEAAAPPKVDRTGGDYGAGLIRDVSVITAGEALGHGLWIDREFVSSTFRAMAAETSGTKSRFTHPDMSADGMAKFLGRFKNPRLSPDGARVVADLHFQKSARKTPDGDLADYVMARAEEDPASCGFSISFQRNQEAEAAFSAEHEATPDTANVKNLPHARLAELHACDVVDEPAANPGGLFHREWFAEIEQTAAYALGISQERPAAVALDADPERLRGFAERFLKSHGLQIVPLAEDTTAADPPPATATEAPEPIPAGDETDDDAVIGDTEPTAGGAEQTADADPAEADTTPPAPPAAPQDTAPELSRETLREYLSLFGDTGGRYLAEGLPLSECYRRELAAAREENLRLQQQLAELGHCPPPAAPPAAAPPAPKFPTEKTPLGASADAVPSKKPLSLAEALKTAIAGGKK